MVSAEIQVSIVVGNRLLTVNGQATSSLNHGVAGAIGIVGRAIVGAVLRCHMDHRAVLDGGGADHIHQVVMSTGGGAAARQLHPVGGTCPQGPVAAHRERADGVAWSDGTAVDGDVTHRPTATEGAAIDKDMGVRYRTVDHQGAIGDGGVTGIGIVTRKDSGAGAALVDAARSIALYDIGRQGQGVGLVEVDGARTSRTSIRRRAGRAESETVSVEHARSGRISKVVSAKVQGALTTDILPQKSLSTAPIDGSRPSVRQGQGAVSGITQGQRRHLELRAGAVHRYPTSGTRGIPHFQL